MRAGTWTIRAVLTLALDISDILRSYPSSSITSVCEETGSRIHSKVCYPPSGLIRFCSILTLTQWAFSYEAYGYAFDDNEVCWNYPIEKWFSSRRKHVFTRNISSWNKHVFLRVWKFIFVCASYMMIEEMPKLTYYARSTELCFQETSSNTCRYAYTLYTPN